MSASVVSSNAIDEPPWVLSDGRRGVVVVGDQDEVFFLDTVEPCGKLLARVRPGDGTAPIAMTGPGDLAGPAVDASHVYWSEGGTGGTEVRVLRASRDGDGSDAEVIAISPIRGDGMFVFDGFLFIGTLRVPTTGGELQPFTTETDWGMFAIGTDRVYVKQYLPPDGTRIRLASLTVDGLMETLADDLPQSQGPLFRGVFDRGELFWTTTSNTMYRMPATGGSPTQIASGIATPIGVTETEILYDFTSRGFQHMPRDSGM